MLIISVLLLECYTPNQHYACCRPCRANMGAKNYKFDHVLSFSGSYNHPLRNFEWHPDYIFDI